MRRETRYSAAARNDLRRLYAHLIDRETTAEDRALAKRTLGAIVDAVDGNLSRWPFVYRKAGNSPLLRELLIPCGPSGVAPPPGALTGLPRVQLRFGVGAGTRPGALMPQRRGKAASKRDKGQCIAFRNKTRAQAPACGHPQHRAHGPRAFGPPGHRTPSTAPQMAPQISMFCALRCVGAAALQMGWWWQRARLKRPRAAALPPALAVQ